MVEHVFFGAGALCVLATAIFFMLFAACMWGEPPPKTMREKYLMRKMTFASLGGLVFSADGALSEFLYPFSGSMSLIDLVLPWFVIGILSRLPVLISRYELKTPNRTQANRELAIGFAHGLLGPLATIHMVWVLFSTKRRLGTG